MKRLGRATLCIALLATLTGCWPQPGQGPNRTGYNPLEATLTRETVGGLHRLWSVDPGSIVGSPVVSRAGVHVAAFDNADRFQMLAYGVGGAELWRQPVTPDAVRWVHATSGAWVVDGRVGAGYYVYDDGFGNWADAPSFDVTTGAPLGPLGDGPIVAIRSRLVASTYRRSISPTQQEAGTRVRDLGSGQVTTVATSDQGSFTLGVKRLYRADRGWVSALVPARSGEPQVLWTTALNGQATTPVLSADESVVYVVANNESAFRATLVALDAATGATLWTATMFGPATMPALANDTLYVQNANGWLISFRASGCGASECPQGWSVAAGVAGAPLPTQPTVAGDVIYTGWGNGSVVAHAVEGGRLWSGSAGSEPVTSGPVVSGGRVYVTTADGALTAFGL